MPENIKPTLLVTGASGHMGRRVLELLLEAKTGPIFAATRTPEKLQEFAARGVTVRQADFDDPATLLSAFAGVDRLLLISTDAVGTPGLRLKQHRTAVEAAEKAGVSHVVYTSFTNTEPPNPVFVAPDHYGTEQALANSKLGFTALRNNIYADLLVSTLAQAAQTGKLFSAAGDGKAGYVTREDCSRAAAAALAAPFVGRRTLDITGPEALSQADLAAIASQISGQKVEYVPLPLEAVINGMVNAGLPGPMAEAYATFDTGIALGKVNVVTGAVEQLTGKKAMRIADFLASQRDAILQASTVN